MLIAARAGIRYLLSTLWTTSSAKACLLKMQDSGHFAPIPPRPSAKMYRTAYGNSLIDNWSAYLGQNSVC